MFTEKTEILDAISFNCPECDTLLFRAENLADTQFLDHPSVKCHKCNYFVARNMIILMRIREETTKGYCFICDDCGRTNFSINYPDKCEYCQSTNS